MAFIVDGFRMSYECEDLISEVKEEIALYGKDHECYAITSERGGCRFVTDYVFQAELDKLGIVGDEVAARTTLGKLLQVLQQQNAVL